jgi:hypothetical protein
MHRLDHSPCSPFLILDQKFAGLMSGGTDFSGEAGSV